MIRFQPKQTRDLPPETSVASKHELAARIVELIESSKVRLDSASVSVGLTFVKPTGPAFHHIQRRFSLPAKV